jgi:cellulose synthase/poly-beta-1,6-N-acetylglucosamine synthase-like glycosyltransferase
MTISLLVPCYNEEKSLEASIKSCLNQTRSFDELIFIDDCSSDNTPKILAKYSNLIRYYRTPKNTGNKSSAQEFGLQFVSGDIMVMTDADTLLDETFAEEIEKSFSDPEIVAVAGRVQSLSYNWLTLCRAYEYAIGQNIHKMAQHYINYIFVMPGASCAFRTKVFRETITFDHDTLTEDLDFTYKLHFHHLKIVFNPKAISYTQDPVDLKNYINQVRRWFGGGWQNLIKYYTSVPKSLIMAFELSLMYSEGVIFSILLFLIFIINPWMALRVLFGYLILALIIATWMAIKEKRTALLFAPFPYMILIFVNAYIYLEQFVKEVVFKKRNLIWFKPERLDMKEGQMEMTNRKS